MMSRTPDFCSSAADSGVFLVTISAHADTSHERELEDWVTGDSAAKIKFHTLSVVQALNEWWHPQ